MTCPCSRASECCVSERETRIEIDGRGRQRLLYRHKCALCAKCWVYADVGVCLYGGPFRSYVEVKDEQAQHSDAKHHVHAPLQFTGPRLSMQ